MRAAGQTRSNHRGRPVGSGRGHAGIRPAEIVGCVVDRGSLRGSTTNTAAVGALGFFTRGSVMADQIVEPAGSHEPTEFAKTPKKAAASGCTGSALEYYDFFIYAQAAALVCPIIYNDRDIPKMNIVIALATFGVGYVARPIGAFVLGHWGDKHGRKNVLVLCMMLMGLSTFCVALLPTYAAIGIFAPILLVACD